MGLIREVKQDQGSGAKQTRYTLIPADQYDFTANNVYQQLSWARWAFISFLTHAPVYSEPLFSWFLLRLVTSLGESIHDDSIDFFKFWELPKESVLFVSVCSVFSVLALLNLSRDFTTANMPEEAYGYATSANRVDRLITEYANTEQAERATDDRTQSTWLPAAAYRENSTTGHFELIPSVRVPTYLSSAILTSFLWITSIALASPDALALVKNRTHPAIKFPVLGFFTILGVSFYHMITFDSILGSMMILWGNLITRPLKTLGALINPLNIPFFLEATWGNQCNAIYRAIACASFSSFMEKVFLTSDQQTSYDQSPWSLTVMVNLFAMAYLLTIGSRLFASLEQNFAPGVTLTRPHWTEAFKALSKGQVVGIDFGFSLVRSACISTMCALMVKDAPTQAAWQIFSAYLLLQGTMVKIINRARRTAIDAKEQEVESRQPGNSSTTTLDTPEALFKAYQNSLVEDGFYSSCGKVPVPLLAKIQNVGALLIRYIAFVFFVVALRQSRFGQFLPDSFKMYQTEPCDLPQPGMNTTAAAPSSLAPSSSAPVECIADWNGRVLIWLFATIIYAAIAENDFNFFQSSFIKNISYWAAKFKLTAPNVVKAIYSPIVTVNPATAQAALVARWKKVGERNQEAQPLLAVAGDATSVNGGAAASMSTTV